MFTRPELEFKSRACLAQLKLRVVVFSMAVALPLWLGLALLQRLGFAANFGHTERAIAVALLLIYAVGVAAIIRRTQHDHGLICPKCQRLLGPELNHVTKNGACARCDEQLIR